MPGLRVIFNRKLLVIFFMALVIRGILFVQVIKHPQVIHQPDSRMYVSLAQGLMQHGTLCYPGMPDQPGVEKMPGYPVFLFLVIALFGNSFLAVIIIQIIIDSLSCVLISYLGEMVLEGAGFLSGILASVNLCMITYSHFILNDSLFLFVFLVLLILMFRFLREPGWRFVVFLGAGLGIAAFIRPVVLYLPIFLIPSFFLYLVIKLHVSFLMAASKVILMGLIFIISLSPWFGRNYVYYGRLNLTAQTGGYALQYVIPFVWQYSKGTSFIEGFKKTNEEFQEKAKKKQLDFKMANPFEVSDLQVEMAIDYLKREPKMAIIKAWIFGVVKNLFAPAIIDLSYLLDIERPHFFYTEGKTLIERALNFMKNMQGFFGWAVIGSLITLILMRFIQLWGFIQAIRINLWKGLLLCLIVFYFLLVSGPIGYAKYRLPFEPIMIILMAIGIRSLSATLYNPSWGGNSLLRKSNLKEVKRIDAL
ncbi:MAG: glycosyltransferase family 39 protein [Thermodesulfobacteriota bacterium]|nr:glycosyltransferase family 39 protein [Thermodesulfobacteriota bacterium]